MRILTLCYEFPPLGGGAAPVVLELSKELTNLGHEADVVTMGFKDLPCEEKIGNVNVYRVKCLRSKREICHTHEMLSYVVAALPKVKNLCNRKKYDLIHSHFIVPTALVAYILKKSIKLPYVITMHGSDVPGYNPDRFRLQHRFIHPLWSRIVKNAGAITSPSVSLKKIFSRHSRRMGVHIIPNGINPGLFVSGEKRKRILLVSRFFERKGIQYFLEALNGFRHDYEVNIVGAGEYEGVLKRTAQRYKLDVNFIGWLDNNSPRLKELYETSSIFVLPSSAENFPITLLEAMSAGTAIITTNATGCPEVVGDAALFVRPGDVENLRSSLEVLIGDERLRAELGKKACRRVEENFSWPIVARQYEKLYQKMLHSQNF